MTLQIDPKAIWDDGTPITSRDFRFTWRAIVTGRESYDPDDYALIRAVDARDPQRVVITFDRVIVAWPELFGGPSGFILEKAAFPEHRGRNPNLSKQMLDNMPFSGGPFRLESWSASSAVFTRNERYFGQQALLDKVTFVPLIDQTSELEAFRRGQVAAIFPTLAYGGPTVEEAFGDNPSVRVVRSNGVYFEAFWFHHSTRKLRDPMVREALMYAIDRQAVIDQIIKPYNPKAEVLNCGFVAYPHLGPWCASKPFERFTYDPVRARAILESAGYDCSGSFCERGGKPLTILYTASSTNARRVATQEIVSKGAEKAGISFRVRSYGSTGPSPLYRPFGLADFATGGEIDPSVTDYFGCNRIPSEENGYNGQNFIAWCNEEADRLMRQSDRELDPMRRLQLMNRIYELQAQDFVSLPLYVQPAVGAWRTDKIAGPIGLYSSTPHGMFFNLNEWYVPA